MSDEESGPGVRVSGLSGEWIEGLRQSLYDRIGTRRTPSYREYESLAAHMRRRHEYESFGDIRPNGDWTNSLRPHLYDPFVPLPAPYTTYFPSNEPMRVIYPASADTMPSIREIEVWKKTLRHAGAIITDKPAKWVRDLIGAENYFPLTHTCSYPKNKFRPKHSPVILRPEFYVRDIRMVNMDEAFDTLEELLNQ